MTDTTKNATQAVFIAGPTASGKSDAALRLAQAIGGEIINADALQIYADLHVLTARPTPDELAVCPHHMYGTVDGAVRFSAGKWATQAGEIAEQIFAREKVPVIVGGTGLYFKALQEGLSPMPEVPAEVRSAGNVLYEEIGGEAFRAQVLSFDPAMVYLPASDRQRLVRAWEIREATGKSLSEFQALPRVPVLKAQFISLVIEPERDELYQSCDLRFERMLATGALEEVKTLLTRQLPADMPVMKSLGVPELAAYISGEISLAEATEEAKKNTRRFAKRQMTWFRGQAGDWPRARNIEEGLAVLTKNMSGKA